MGCCEGLRLKNQYHISPVLQFFRSFQSIRLDLTWSLALALAFASLLLSGRISSKKGGYLFFFKEERAASLDKVSLITVCCSFIWGGRPWGATSSQVCV